MVRRLNIGDKSSFVILCVVLGFGIFLLAAMVQNYLAARKLVATGRQIEAAIVEVVPQPKTKTLEARYSYQVGGTTYTGSVSPYRGTVDDRGAIQVTYLPDDPGFSATDPKAVAGNALGGVFALCVFCSVAGVLLGVSRRQMKRRQ